MSKTIDVWVVIIEHKHGRNVSAVPTEDAAQEIVAEFARDWWQDFNVVGDDPSAEEYEKEHGRAAFIERYFELENTSGGSENVAIELCGMELP